MMGKIGFICETCGNVASNRQHKASNRQHKAGGLHIGIEITQNADWYAFEQPFEQWRHQHIPTIDSFSPVCDIMFPKGVGSLGASRDSEVLGVPGILEASESRESRSLRTMNCTIAVILVSEKWNEHNLMYIDHKQCEIMQKIQWNSSKANFTDFPLTDGAVVEPQCLCKWLQEIDSKRKSISVHCFCRVFAHFLASSVLCCRLHVCQADIQKENLS